MLRRIVSGAGTMVAYSVEANENNSADDDRVSARKITPQKLFGGMALGAIGLACGWFLYANLAGDRADAVLAGATITLVAARAAAPPITVVARQPARTERTLLTAPVLDVTLMRATTSLGAPGVTFAQSAPLASALRATPPVRRIASIPMPVPRPAAL